MRLFHGHWYRNYAVIWYIQVVSSSLQAKVLYIFIIFSLRAVCSAHTVVFYIFAKTFGLEYKLWSSSVCDYLYVLVTSFLWVTNTVLSSSFTNTLNSVCLLRWELYKHEFKYNSLTSYVTEIVSCQSHEQHLC